MFELNLRKEFIQQKAIKRRKRKNYKESEERNRITSGKIWVKE